MSFSALMWQFVSTFSDEIELQLVWDLKFKMLSTMQNYAKLLKKKMDSHEKSLWTE